MIEMRVRVYYLAHALSTYYFFVVVVTKNLKYDKTVSSTNQLPNHNTKVYVFNKVEIKY